MQSQWFASGNPSVGTQALARKKFLKSCCTNVVCQQLMQEGVLCKETHENVMRFAPPLTITRDEIDWGLDRIEKVLS